MEIRAVATTGITGVVDITSPPALAGLVVLHGRNNVIVNSPSFLEIAFSAGGIDHLLGPLLDLTVDGHKPIRLKPACCVWIALLFGCRGCPVTGHLQPLLNVFLPQRLKTHRDGEASLLGVVQAYVQNPVSVLSFTNLIRVR